MHSNRWHSKDNHCPTFKKSQLISNMDGCLVKSVLRVYLDPEIDLYCCRTIAELLQNYCSFARKKKVAQSKPHPHNPKHQAARRCIVS